MKKALISLLIGLGCFCFNIIGASAQPINSAFKDDNFYSCVVESWQNQNRPVTRGASNDYTEDVSDIDLTDEELAEIEELNCSNRNIKDVSGIEKLTGLYYLDLEDNQIEHINLSKNLYLENLYLEGNNLTCVDLSKNLFIVREMLLYFQPGNPVFAASQQRGQMSPELAYEDAANDVKHLMIEYGEDLEKGLKHYNIDTGMNLIYNSEDGNACEVKADNSNKVIPLKNKISTDKNPKTGLNLPVVGGICLLFVMLGLFIVINKKNLFRNI